MKKLGDVRQVSGTPVAADFTNTGGTPLVVDISSGDVYYMDAAGAIQTIAGGGGGAPTTATYVTLSTDATLVNERVLTAGANIAFTDAGPGGTLTVDASITKAVGVTFDGGGSALVVNSKADIRVPYAGTITAVTMLADQSGSAVVDIWKDTYANYPPTAADSITAAAKPTISADDQSVDTTLTGWTTAITANDCLRFNVDSCSTITRLTLILTVAV